ncbi:MAG: NAD(P)H-dependent oxidoreductase [Methanoregula sp.]|nr:MAG: NAD(P)H-dependent oxidoreductase [Methanoregula sp.]
MKICIIYHSETGNTRHVAQHLASACSDVRLIEVYDRADYLPLTRFLSRCKKARGEEMTPIEPVSIDVAGYDLLVLGSPVWAFKPTPVIHAAIDCLRGCEGKAVIGFFTHGGRPGSSEETFTAWCEKRKMQVKGTMTIHMKEIENEKKAKELFTIVSAAVRA